MRGKIIPSHVNNLIVMFYEVYKPTRESETFLIFKCTTTTMWVIETYCVFIIVHSFALSVDKLVIKHKYKFNTTLDEQKKEGGIGIETLRTAVLLSQTRVKNSLSTNSLTADITEVFFTERIN